MRQLLPLLLLVGCVAHREVPMAALPEPQVLEVASVHGKYAELLLTFEAPEDVGRYGQYADWGWWDGRRYKGVDVPRGYWVYVYPVWYVWEQLAER